MGNFCCSDDKSDGIEYLRDEDTLLCGIDENDKALSPIEDLNKSRSESLASTSYRNHEAGFFETERGIKLWWQKYLPIDLDIQPQCLVMFLHGIHEHCARYDHVMEQIATRLDAVVVTYDHQSHGRSDDVRGNRGACNTFDEFVQDADYMLDFFIKDFKNVPVFLWGQGFGGLVSCHLSIKRKDLIKNLLLSSPAIDVEWNLTRKLQAKMADVPSKMTPDLPFFPVVDPTDMSKDKVFVKEYVNDPLNTLSNVRARTGCEIVNAYEELKQKRSKIELENLLIIFGDTDNCYSLPAAKDFHKNVYVKSKTELKVFKDLYHTLFHEPEKQEVIDYLIQFIDNSL